MVDSRADVDVEASSLALQRAIVLHTREVEDILFLSPPTVHRACELAGHKFHLDFSKQGRSTGFVFA